MCKILSISKPIGAYIGDGDGVYKKRKNDEKWWLMVKTACGNDSRNLGNMMIKTQSFFIY